MAKDRIYAACEAMDDDFNFFRGGPPGEAAVAALEAELGRSLPPAHRSLVAAAGCVAVVADEKVWPAPQAYEIRPRWQMIRGLEIFGVAPPGHPLSLVGKRAEFVQVSEDEDLIPLGKVIGVNRWLCADEDGDVQWWEPDEGGFVDGVVEAVEEFLDQLAKDKKKIKKEGVSRS